jgi:hypothetical protein
MVGLAALDPPYNLGTIFVNPQGLPVHWGIRPAAFFHPGARIPGALPVSGG